MFLTDREPPGADERYECATNATNLTATPSDLPAGALDALLAGAWGARRLGGLLIRLAAQWAGEKPRRMEPRSVRWLVASGYTREKAQELHEADAKRCARTYAWAMVGLVKRLRELPAVRHQVTVQAVRWDMGLPRDAAERAALTAQRVADVQRLHRALQAVRLTQGASYAAIEDLAHTLAEIRDRSAADARAQYQRAAPIAAAAVHFWLDQTCRSCHGRCRGQIAGTPMLSAQPCSACRGTGKAPIPYGEDGRRLVAYLDQCQFRAQQGIDNRR